MPNRTDLAKAGAALVAVLAALGLIYWIIIGRPQLFAQEAVTAKAGQVVAEQRGQAVAESARIIERHFTETNRIERITADARAEVRSAPDADAVHRAALGPVCLLAPPPGGAANPACALPGSGAEKPAG